MFPLQVTQILKVVKLEKRSFVLFANKDIFLFKRFENTEEMFQINN